MSANAAIDALHPTNELSGQVALIVGASRGIGACIARALADDGAAVVLAARDPVALRNVTDDITRRGGEAIHVRADATDDPQLADAVATCMDSFGHLDIAVNNAAARGAQPVRIVDLPLEQFDDMIAVSLRGVFAGMRHQIRAMLATGGGSIVNIASTAGLQAVGGIADYVAAKHGVIGLTASAALDHAADRIRINAIAPGPILTDALIHAGPETQQRVANAVPLGRLGDPSDVAAAVRWLCSPAAAFVTGTTLCVDGGRLAGTPPFVTPPDATRSPE